MFLMPTARFAAMIGISERRVNQLVVEGVFVRPEPGQIDATASVRSYIAHIEGKAQKRGAALDLNAEKARLAKEQADGQALRNEQTRGDLLPRDAVEAEWADILRKTRAGLMAVPSRVRSRFGLDAAVTAGLDREIRDALEALADDRNDPPEGVGEPAPAAPA